MKWDTTRIHPLVDIKKDSRGCLFRIYLHYTTPSMKLSVYYILNKLVK